MAFNSVAGYTYDLGDRLTALSAPSGSAASFSFDSLGRHASRSVGAVTDTYTYLGSSETVAGISTGGVTTGSLLDPGGARLANTNTTSGLAAFSLPDLHANLAAAELASGTSLADAFRYDGYGGTIAVGGSHSGPAQPYRYQGRLDLSPDAAQPLYAAGARFYQPSLGVFTQLDSVAGSVADPLSLNRYLYAEANPATLIDPDGHMVTTGTLDNAPVTDKSQPITVVTQSHPGAAGSTTVTTYGTTAQHNQLQTSLTTVTSHSRPHGSSGGIPASSQTNTWQYVVGAQPGIDAWGQSLGFRTVYSGYVQHRPVDPLSVLIAGGVVLGGVAAALAAADCVTTFVGNPTGIGGCYAAGAIATGFASGGADVGIGGPSVGGKFGGVTNPVPESLTFARALRPAQAEALAAGMDVPLSAYPGAAQAFVTASDALPAGMSRSQVAAALGIPEENVGAVLRFRMQNPEGIASPINRDIPGFIGGGRTSGGVPEFVISNQGVTGFPWWILEYPGT